MVGIYTMRQGSVSVWRTIKFLGRIEILSNTILLRARLLRAGSEKVLMHDGQTLDMWIH